MEHQKAMALLANANIAGQMMSVLRQELDTMVRVIYLLSQGNERRQALIDASVAGEIWRQETSKGRVTDREMVDLAQRLMGWTQSVYKFGCAFIHLSSLHDYNYRDPIQRLPNDERQYLLEHVRFYHGGPMSDHPTFADYVPYLPAVLEKVSSNLEYWLRALEKGKMLNPDEI